MKRNLNLLFFLFVFLFTFLYLSNCGKQSNSEAETDTKKEGRFKMEKIRKPTVANQFYPGDPVTLTRQITAFFKKAKKEPIPGKIIGLIAPHAGYMYSGQVAAYAFKLLEGFSFETVVVICPTHIALFRGASIYNGGAYETPLGVIAVDTSLAGKMADANERVFLSTKGHGFVGMRGEHSLEVELPFLQLVLGKFKLVPIVIGDQDQATCEALAEALIKSLKGESALIVASSDLSHFHPYDEAVRLDNIVINHVNSFDAEALFSDLAAGTCEACGGSPVVATMLAAKGLGADKAKVLKYANSGDVTGDRSGVVGYMAAVLYDSGAKHEDEKKSEKEKERNKGGLSEKDKETLMHIARTTIEHKVKGKEPPEFEADSPILREKRGAFVTIHKQGRLRGCIGYIEAIKPLWVTIQEMAESAALNDPRFPPVSPDELGLLDLEISVLTPLKRIKDINEIQIGKHGILLKSGYHQGVFLPQVATEQGWDRITFLNEICFKAGIHDKNCWKSEDAEIYIFSAEVFEEKK
ncbi:MAG: AmmeMemoRadiSam system protein B [candidate division Zixibacteria bacterium]|nr:AmmeMemoRadiSam system protein B [candidate division Zixibacteria bacterium]